MTINLIEYCEKNDKNPFDIMPVTFLIDLYNPLFEKEMKKYVNYFLE